MPKRILKYICCLLVAIQSNTSFAINPLPGSADPGRVNQNFIQEQVGTSLPTASVARPQEPPPTRLAKEAQKIKFVLNKVIITGNHVYTNQELQKIYKDKLGKKISIAELIQIGDNITNFYRNNGYILTQAILPPQHIKKGVVKIRVIEGYVKKVNIVGNPRGANRILLGYGKKISEDKPLKMETLEHYLLLANLLPGTQVRAVLEPSKTQGAADLSLVVKQNLITGVLSYDDYGTLYMGPHQITANMSLNSIFLPGDSTRFLYLTATQDHELRYGDVNYIVPLGASGAQFILDANKSLTHPGFVLEPFDTIGVANTYLMGFVYPLILSSSRNLVLNGSMTYLNTRNTQLGFLLYNDRIRQALLGVTYNFSDKYKGVNQMYLSFMHGFNIMNASNNPDSLQSSRFGADGLFTKWNAQLTRNQAVYDKFSLFFLAQGQYSYNPLLSAVQYGFGGSQLGRGYDPAEILGDRGAAGSVELRMDNYPAKFSINTIQMYMFYDAGVIWNVYNLPGNPAKQSATSAGGGVRLSFNKYISGNFFIAQPLTKPVAAESLIGRGRNPRTFFSIIGNFP